MVAFVMTIIEAVFGAIGAAYLWFVTTRWDEVETEVMSELPTEEPEFQKAAEWGVNFARDWIIAMAVTFTIFVVLYIIMAVLIYKYYASVPRPPPQQPLRVIQPATIAKPPAYGLPGY